MGMLNTAKYYLKTGILQAPAHFQLCLGAPGGMEATTENLLYLVNHLPEDCTWSAFGIGKGANEVMLARLLSAEISAWVLRTMFIITQVILQNPTNSLSDALSGLPKKWEELWQRLPKQEKSSAFPNKNFNFGLFR